MPTSENTARDITLLPDKVWLFFIALFTGAIGIVISYMVILNTQATLVENDLRIQKQVDDNSKGMLQQNINMQQQSLNINTLTVKLDALADKVSAGPGP